eukprot:30353-Eustigmatos_ZCMA.PRE.1
MTPRTHIVVTPIDNQMSDRDSEHHHVPGCGCCGEQSAYPQHNRPQSIWELPEPPTFCTACVKGSLTDGKLSACTGC